MSWDWVEQISWVLGVLGLLLSVVGARVASRRSSKEREQASTVLSGVSTVILGDTYQVSPVTNEEPELRIQRIARSLRDSQVLINELQTEMDAKIAAVERLRMEEEQSRQLASLREEEAQAVRNLVSATIDSAHLQLQGRLEQERDELRANLDQLQAVLAKMEKTGRRDQILFFALGVAASIPVGIVINTFF